MRFSGLVMKTLDWRAVVCTFFIVFFFFSLAQFLLLMGSVIYFTRRAFVHSKGGFTFGPPWLPSGHAISVTNCRTGATLRIL